MTVYCPNCQSKARITSRNNLNDEKTVADLYCQCLNVKECGATFVTTLGFKHYLNPPAQSTLQLAANLLNTLTKAERAALLQGMPPG
ncbi:ogr/Delta-like zinc finger family protein [Methylomonas sp. MS20]|uniref:ogr/Delta-like zinc finger family protein n=1 Tax=unclassified Methylomonas TaxID=2608980 RepID=UPI0028A51B55|nr:ogr/Delta-like zinc finger family protein [Methylomonas sp. MV1]MDT4328740.1 ogr/Delta-like zinc finger family protein [Methylomonas sp. MV1]